MERTLDVVMPGPPPTLAQLRATFDGLLARAIAEGLPAPSCNGLHPDTVDAIDAVAAAYPAAPPSLIGAARVSFARNLVQVNDFVQRSWAPTGDAAELAV